MGGSGRLDASDLSVRHSGQGAVTVGWGIVISGGHAAFRRLEVDGTFDYGLLVEGGDDSPTGGTVVEAEDVVIRGLTQGPTEVHVVTGVDVGEASSVTL